MKDSGNPEVMALLLQLVKENSGVLVAEQDGDSSFFELGLDSLFLTQFSVSLASRFGVKLTFRQLSAQFDTLNKLAGFLREASATGASGLAVPAPAPLAACAPQSAPRAARAAPTTRAAPAAGQGDPLIQLFLGQLDVMQRQLDALAEVLVPAPASDAGQSSQPPMPAAVATPTRRPAPPAAPDAGNAIAAPAVLDAARPPVPGARLGRDPAGQPAWFVPKADQPGKYVKLV